MINYMCTHNIHVLYKMAAVNNGTRKTILKITLIFNFYFFLLMPYWNLVSLNGYTKFLFYETRSIAWKGHLSRVRVFDGALGHIEVNAVHKISRTRTTIHWFPVCTRVQIKHYNPSSFSPLLPITHSYRNFLCAKRSALAYVCTSKISDRSLMKISQKTPLR